MSPLESAVGLVDLLLLPVWARLVPARSAPAVSVAPAMPSPFRKERRGEPGSVFDSLRAAGWVSSELRTGEGSFPLLMLIYAPDLFPPEFLSDNVADRGRDFESA